jgi:2-hydroxycyclohexanecarboxyl-CoA dehydrogenase
VSDSSDPTRILDLTGRVALVTGAGQGVGAAIATYLAANGAAVAVNDYVAERAETVAEEIRSRGGTAIGVQGDVTDFDAVTGAVATIARELGPVTVLVNNAGNAGANPPGLSGAPFWESEPSAWEPYLRVNLYGVLYCCRAVVPGMIDAGHGRLITVISDAGRMGEPRLEAYSAAKAGAAGLMRALARSLGRYRITANSVAIAFTQTPTTAGVLADERFTRKMLSNYIIRRVGEPTDPAGLVTFLASSAADWITAQTYPVNGGFSVSQ